LNCHDCHPINGVDLPAPAAGGGISLMLGGPVHEVRTDGYFVTSIIHPSHRVRRYSGGEGVEGSPMPDYTEKMTLRQLIDLVAFLQSRYEIVPRPFVPY
jgi:hypothetical protein